MVKTWKTEKGEDESCPGCGAVYEVSITQLPARDSDRFKCIKCSCMIKEWNSTESYSYKLKE